MTSAKGRYVAQRSKAIARGIEWKFTFETWMLWWGEDYERRGKRVGQISMQRLKDSGPYSPENTRKGTARDNQRTRAAMYRNKQQKEAKANYVADGGFVAGVKSSKERLYAKDDGIWIEQNLGMRSMYDSFY